MNSNNQAMNTIFIICVMDIENNHCIVDLIPCLNNDVAIEEMAKLKQHPKYSLPCYYAEVQEYDVC